MNNDLEKGTQIPYIERAMKEGYEVVVFNTNLNKCPDVSRDIGVEVHDVPVMSLTSAGFSAMQQTTLYKTVIVILIVIIILFI